jgi:hypothetical protein
MQFALYWREKLTFCQIIVAPVSRESATSICSYYNATLWSPFHFFQEKKQTAIVVEAAVSRRLLIHILDLLSVFVYGSMKKRHIFYKKLQ